MKNFNESMDFTINETINVVYEGGEYEGEHSARIVSFPSATSAKVEWLSEGEHKGTCTVVNKRYLQKVTRGKKRKLSVVERVEALEYFLEEVVAGINTRLEALEKEAKKSKATSKFVLELSSYTNENFGKIHRLLKK